MTRSFDRAVADVRARRKALQSTAEDMRARMSPPQLAEDALSLIDPQLSLLGRLKSRVQSNRLLSLAVLAGVGWLAGAPRQHEGAPPDGQDASTTPRANMKEKKNDSGQIHGDDWSGSGTGRPEERWPQDGPEGLGARRSRKAQDGSVAPHSNEPEQPHGQRRQQVAEREQQFGAGPEPERPEVGRQQQL